jgi:hypothetical protein
MPIAFDSMALLPNCRSGVTTKDNSSRRRYRWKKVEAHFLSGKSSSLWDLNFPDARPQTEACAKNKHERTRISGICAHDNL